MDLLKSDLAPSLITTSALLLEGLVFAVAWGRHAIHGRFMIGHRMRSFGLAMKVAFVLGTLLALGAWHQAERVVFASFGRPTSGDVASPERLQAWLGEAHAAILRGDRVLEALLSYAMFQAVFLGLLLHASPKQATDLEGTRARVDGTRTRPTSGVSP
jgi:hypothetical protein